MTHLDYDTKTEMIFTGSARELFPIEPDPTYDYPKCHPRTVKSTTVLVPGTNTSTRTRADTSVYSMWCTPSIVCVRYVICIYMHR